MNIFLNVAVINGHCMKAAYAGRPLSVRDWSIKNSLNWSFQKIYNDPSYYSVDCTEPKLGIQTTDLN